ncbi:NXPE family member 1-like [Mytilus trossulus]|uniref:NXPE family member 1-like n=1 Tax=Mytilus trossulus TaxID=6551 RepID=UPI0030057E3B
MTFSTTFKSNKKLVFWSLIFAVTIFYLTSTKLFGWQILCPGYTNEVETFTATDFKYYEKYIKYKGLDFGKSLAYLPKSTVEIINNKSATFTTGDIITLRIILHNKNGDVVTESGDFLKVWMSEKGKGAGSAGYIVDHGNGTYIGVIKALWRGSPHIKISLSFSKESIGLYVNYIHRNGMLRAVKGIFKNARGEIGKGSCGIHTLTNITNSICDFTSLNYGMRWFCLLPNATGFDCSDWYSVTGDMTVPTFTNAQQQFLSTARYKIIKEIKVDVLGDKTIGHPKHSCSLINPSLTWNISSPVGYFYNKTWHNLLCQKKVEPSFNRYLACLRNREIYMVGDSTSRDWLISLADILDVKRTSADLRGHHEPIKVFSKNKRDNITIIWVAHEFPFFTYTPNGTIHHFKPASYHLNVIRSKNPIVILHWFIHIGYAPLSVYEEHVMNAKDAIVKFMDRVPGAKVFIKGPHYFEQYAEGVPYDFVRYFHDKMIFKIFDNIKHKVVYLNEWDITVSSENKELHPSTELRKPMLHELLSYIC